MCGTSVGALVGAAYAAGELERFAHWLLGMRRDGRGWVLDVGFSGGMLKGGRLMDVRSAQLRGSPDRGIAIPFCGGWYRVADWRRGLAARGLDVEAVRASLALPALFTPVLHDGVTLVDGGLVNPVPVSLARAMGAEIVIAVDLGSDLLGRHLRADPRPSPASSQVGDWLRKLQDSLGIEPSGPPRPRGPSMLDVIASSLNVMQVRITRSRIAGDPPDAMIAPRLAHLGLLDFHRAREAIEEGSRAVESALPGLRALGLGPAAAPDEPGPG